MIRLRDSIVVLNTVPGALDERGSYDDEVVTEVVEKARIQPRFTDEYTVAGQSTDTRYLVTLTPDTSVTSTSKIRWHGETYEVDGEVLVVTTYQGRLHHRETYIKLETYR